MADAGTPVVFVHGLWLHADSWSAWVDRFRESGYAPVAPGWPGDAATVEETRKDPQRVAGFGIDDVVEHYAEIIRALIDGLIESGMDVAGAGSEASLRARVARRLGTPYR